MRPHIFHDVKEGPLSLRVYTYPHVTPRCMGSRLGFSVGWVVQPRFAPKGQAVSSRGF